MALTLRELVANRGSVGTRGRPPVRGVGSSRRVPGGRDGSRGGRGGSRGGRGGITGGRGGITGGRGGITGGRVGAEVAGSAEASASDTADLPLGNKDSSMMGEEGGAEGGEGERTVKGGGGEGERTVKGGGGAVGAAGAAGAVGAEGRKGVEGRKGDGDGGNANMGAFS